MTRPRSRWLTVFAALGAILIAAYLIVFIGLRVYVSPSYLKTHLERVVSTASEGLYTADFDEIAVGWDLSIRILDGRLVPVPGTNRTGRSTVEASFGRFSLKGVQLWPLIRHRRLHVRSLELRQPEFRVTFAGQGDLPSIAAEVNRRVGEAVKTAPRSASPWTRSRYRMASSASNGTARVYDRPIASKTSTS